MDTLTRNTLMKFQNLELMKFNIDMIHTTMQKMDDDARVLIMSEFLIPLEIEYNLLNQSIYN